MIDAVSAKTWPASADRSVYAEDALLVASAQTGNLAAFESLFGRYQGRIYNIIYGMVGNAEDASDLTQDTFFKAYRALGSLRDGQAFYAWLCRIAVNLCCNFRRGHPSVPPLSIEEGAMYDGERAPLDIPDLSYEPARLAEVSATADAVRHAIAGLSPDHRQVVVMHHLEGMPVDQIARIVGVPIGTVKSRLSRGRDCLKRALRTFVEA